MQVELEKAASALDLARSAAYGLLAEGLRYPDPEGWTRLHDRERWALWPEILCDADESIRGPLRRVQELLFSPDPETGTVSLGDARDNHVRLFGHTAKGACPMYELEYGQGEIFQRSADLSDLKGFYEAFGLELNGEGHERADHITVQLEFLAVMAAKEAFAREKNNVEAAEILAEAHRNFLEAHLGLWVPSFARRVAEASPESFYAVLAEFARTFIAAECARFDAETGPATLELRPAMERDETVQACAVEDFGGACPMHADE